MLQHRYTHICCNNTYICYNIYMLQHVCVCCNVSEASFFCFFFFLLLKNHTQKFRAEPTEIQHTRCSAPPLRIPSSPRIILPAVQKFYKQMVLINNPLHLFRLWRTAVLPSSHSFQMVTRH